MFILKLNENGVYLQPRFYLTPANSFNTIGYLATAFTRYLMNGNSITLNLSFLREFCHNDKKKMTRYIHTFLESVPSQLQEIQKAVASGHWEGIKSAAHSLKPQVAFIGLPVAQVLIEKIEEHAIPNFSEVTIRELTSELNQAMEEATDALIQTLLTFS